MEPPQEQVKSSILALLSKAPKAHLASALIVFFGLLCTLVTWFVLDVRSDVKRNERNVTALQARVSALIEHGTAFNRKMPEIVCKKLRGSIDGSTGECMNSSGGLYMELPSLADPPYKYAD